MCLILRLFSRPHSCLFIASSFLSYLFPWTSYDSGFVYFSFYSGVADFSSSFVAVYFPFILLVILWYSFVCPILFLLHSFVGSHRDTFVNRFDSEAALKEGASDLGFDLSAGGLPHKREFARVVTSWKTAKEKSETKLQTDAIARAHGVPVTLLPCDWTSLVTEFKNKFGKHIPDDKLPAQSMFEKF